MPLPLFCARDRRRIIVLASLLVCTLALLGGAPVAARADGIFVADCSFSHRASDDPIVFHGLPGMSHSHDFYGNGSTNAFSTIQSLRHNAGNCVPADDRSAYWTPTLYRMGRPLKAVQVQAYYMDFFRYGRVLTFPPGLRILAGGGMGMVAPAGTAGWTCRDDHGSGTRRIPSCGSSFVTLRVRFPDCWDGRRLDSPDHRSHMAYNSANGMELGLQRCPASHPVVVPQLQLNVVYPIHDGKDVRLASGSVLTAHADFFDGWKPSILQQRVDDVLNGGQACDDFLGCMTISPPNTEPVVARPRARFISRFYPPPKSEMPGHHGMPGMS